MRRVRTNRVRDRGGFSIVEMLVALTITSTLLAATLSALDASFKSYKVTSESASTHVVSRIVTQRLTAMIRNGDEFGPYPVNPITDPIIESDWIEFVSFRDEATGIERVTRLERVAGDENTGPFVLNYTRTTFSNGIWQSEDTRPLLEGLMDLDFVMEYDVGPRLLRVTIDMIVQPDDLQDAAINADLEAPTIRMVTSATPLRLD